MTHPTPTLAPSPAISAASLALFGVCSVVFAAASPSVARAASSAGGEEFMSTVEAAPPNVIFLVDLSSDMGDPCHTTSGAFTNTCLDDVLNAIDMVAQHFDFARYGVVGTSASASDNGFYPIAPLGSTYAEMHAAIEALRTAGPHASTTRNHSEALSDLARTYFSATDLDDPSVDSDGDGIGYDFTKAAIEYSCQTSHVIVLTKQRPEDDSDAAAAFIDAIGADVTCDAAGRTTAVSAGDEQCSYDNVVSGLYRADLRGDLTGDQNIVVHTVGLGIGGTTVAEELYGSASLANSPAGVYANAGDADQILTYILYVMKDIRSGTYSRSTPVVSADGNYLVYSFYELNGDEEVGSGAGLALGQGHIRAYSINNDPSSAAYGQVEYDHTNCGDDMSYSCGGALWDGGDLLLSRLVTEDDQQDDDNDGELYRDIYTFWEPAASLSYRSFGAISATDRAMPLDRRFVDAVGSDPATLNLVLDTTTDTSGCPTSSSLIYNFDKVTGSPCASVDASDLRSLVAFVRGNTTSEFRYLSDTRGRWRLGDSPHSVPVVVQARNSTFAIEPSYRRFLELLEAGEADGSIPSIVLQAANDGMLHAFALSDVGTTTHTDQGEELWAWVPGYLLEREHAQDWSGRLVDMMLFGRTFLFDGSPVVEDVWIDANGDGSKDCDSLPDNCEWRRVVVVQQGQGGPVTLALDITDTNRPTFLWEQTDETDRHAMGYTTSRPVLANVYDTSTGTPTDRWVAFWGSGRGVPTSSSYELHESNLYAWAVGDSYWESSHVGYQAPSSGAGYARGDNWHPQLDLLGSGLNADSDSHSEYGYISAALAVVDVDSDGDADTLYFPVTTAYQPTDEGGGGPGDIASPGSTWMYKACIDSTDPGDLNWVEFFDPRVDGGLTSRPEVYYSATTSWLRDGSLGVYWGTGTPYSRSQTGSNGYFFAMKDSAPGSCAGDTMEPLTDCGTGGVLTLAPGEGLTSDPIVYAGVVYYSTWIPAADRCDGGTGRIYGIDFQDCSNGIDTNGDGSVTAADAEFIEAEDSYISGLTVTDKGNLFYGTSNAETDGSGAPVGTINAATDPFLGTNTLAWMEVF